eukprot:TRINITY_DN1383_c2_g1_i1.p1 TRINITY_DN1383_c2_g1~~TRINITY_DN1383_c2_g1_i1.p1  ORF type:complete len:553 (+),score=199.62 TRINITY_DN1383_c2_g1_i1:620-2278(+)
MAANEKDDETVGDPATGRFRQIPNQLLCSEVGRSSKHVFKAYDSETAMELAWIEYWNMPLRCINAFEGKIELLKSIDHPHIVKYYDAWVDKKNKRVTVITEAMPAPSNSNVSNLKRFLTRALQMKPNVLKRWLLQILSGLHYLHSRTDDDGNAMPYIHFDVRCDNIFIRPNTSKLKLGALEQSIFINSSYPAAFEGTPGFMPVELYHQTPADVKADVHAFGMAALEMFTKAMPYSECSSSLEIFAKQLQGVPPQAYTRLVKENSGDEEVLLQLKLLSKCLCAYEGRLSTGELFLHKYFLSVYKDSDWDPQAYGLSPATSERIAHKMQSLPEEERKLSEDEVRQKITTMMATTFHPTDLPPGVQSLESGRLSPTPSQTSLTSSMCSLPPPAAETYDHIERMEQQRDSLPYRSEQQLMPEQGRLRPSIKCFFPGTVHNQLHARRTSASTSVNQECVRVYFDEVADIASLKAMLSDDLGVDLSLCKIKYVDSEGDLVSFTPRTTLDELVRLANTLQIYPQRAADVPTQQPAVSAYIPSPLSAALVGHDEVDIGNL